MINYQTEPELSPDSFIDVLNRSTLGERRPVHDPERIRQMLLHASLILTARDAGKLVGVARSLSDFVYCTYLSDLAVDVAYQRQGIGVELIRQTQLLAPQAKLILLSAPAATGYYPKIGMTRHEYCYYLDGVNALK